MFSDISGISIVIFLISLVTAMVFHEAMHGFMAHWLGDSTAQEAGRLTLNPMKHIDLYTTILLPMVLLLAHLPPILVAKPVPFNPDRVKYDEFGVALVGAAGPVTNLLLAVIAGIAFRLLTPQFDTILYKSIVIFAEVNVALFLFNLIPIPPLDGSRILYAFAPEPLQDFMRQIEAFGFLAVLAFVFILFQFVSGTFVNIENSILQFLLG